MSDRAFLLFTGTNERAVVALTRVFADLAVPFALIARGPSDRIHSTRHAAMVVHSRRGDDLTWDVLAEAAQHARARLGDVRLVVVPISEYFNRFLLTLDRVRLSSEIGCEVPLVEERLYVRLSDKQPSTAFFRAAGLRVPRSLDAFSPAALPCVAKPGANVGDDGVVRYPILLRDCADLRRFLSRPDCDRYFAQEYIEGTSVYLLAYLPRRGRPRVASQRNIAQQPGGKSIVLAETADFHHDEAARRCLQALHEVGFHGFAMIEFIIDRTGPCFIEINPRPWGPLQLCVDAGSGIVEAFAGDWLEGDVDIHPPSLPRRTRYLWLGGLVESRRRAGALRWDPACRRRTRAIAGALSSDVYLRPDTWRVFLRELWRG